MADDVVPAHQQRLTVHFLETIPAHEPRQHDPHYHLFEEAKRKIKAMGLWKCAMPLGPHSDQLELHHADIEFSLQGGVDLAKFNQLYGLHLASDDEFRAYIESPGALEVLCSNHHRTRYGIHVIPEPEWQALRVWRDDLPPPIEVVS